MVEGRPRHDRHNAIGQQDRFFDAVGDHDGRHPSIRLRSEFGQVLLKRLARERVERAKRVVQKEHLRLGRDRARDRDALTHPTRELSRPAVQRVAEADVAERFTRSNKLPLASEIRERRFDSKPDVLERRKPGEQRVVLKDERRMTMNTADRFAADTDRSSIRHRQAREEAEQRRLARAHGADNRHELALLDIDRDISQHVSRRPVRGEGLVNVSNLDERQ